MRACGPARYRQLAWLYPVTTALVVLATGNHYLVDAAAGVTVVALAELAYRGRARRRASVDLRDRTVPTAIPRTERTRSSRLARVFTGQSRDLSGLAPALVVVPTFDPAADHGRSYAERLRRAGTPARVVEHPGATHAFLSMPGVVPQAKAARAEIAEFLRGRLAG